MRDRVSRLLCVLLIVSLAQAAVVSPAAAALVATPEVAETDAGDARARLSAAIARPDVTRRLEALGITPAEAEARVAAMSDAEVRQAAAHLDRMPAGGDFFGVLVAIFLLMLLSDLLGITHLFPFTKPIRSDNPR